MRKRGLFSAEHSLRCAEPKAMECATDCKTRKLRVKFRAVLESAEILVGDMYSIAVCIQKFRAVPESAEILEGDM